MRIPGVTKDFEGSIMVPERVRATFHHLFVRILSRYMHVWQGEFIRIHEDTIALKSEDPLRKKLKNYKYRSAPADPNKVPMPRAPSNNT